MDDEESLHQNNVNNKDTNVSPVIQMDIFESAKHIKQLRSLECDSAPSCNVIVDTVLFLGKIGH